MNMRTHSFLILSFILLIQCSEVKKTDWDEVYRSQGLEKVEMRNDNILVKLRYSTPDNFVGKDIYGDLEDAYLQPEALEKLYKASDLLKERYPDMKLLIWDAARPRRIQQLLWDTVDIPLEERSKYVANPESGSIHNYGCAVDITLTDSNGNPVDMGTDYDDFRINAHTDNEQSLVDNGLLTEEGLKNRLILREVLTEAGFSTIRSEWWHFDAFPRAETTSRFKIVE